MSRVIRAIVIGGSAGSFTVVQDILASLPADFNLPVILCVHRLKNVKEGFAEALQFKSKLLVKEPHDKEKIRNRTVYLSPANYHMYVELDKTLALSTEEMLNYSRPSIDLTMQSAAYVYKKGLLGIILSGANKDGAVGLSKIKTYGGLTVIQNLNECMVSTMPEAANKITPVDYELTANEIIEFLKEIHFRKYVIAKDPVHEFEKKAG